MSPSAAYAKAPGCSNLHCSQKAQHQKEGTDMADLPLLMSGFKKYYAAAGAGSLRSKSSSSSFSASSSICLASSFPA